MTIPSTWMFPLHTEKIMSEDGYRREEYWREFVFNIQRMYENLAIGINGDVISNSSTDSRTWTPTLQGSTSGTFTYDHQIGWVYRRGIFVDLWFDIKWTAAGTAANNLYLELPYVVALSSQKPFVGMVQSSSITYSAGTGIVINAIPDTFRGEFWNVGSGVATANQQVVASGQLIGYLSYIGQFDE